MLASDNYLKLVDTKKYADVQEVTGVLRKQVAKFSKNMDKINRAQKRVQEILGTESDEKNPSSSKFISFPRDQRS